MTAQLALALDDTFAPSQLADRPKPARHLCAACRARPARFQYHGVVKADRLHTLCFQCYRAAMDRVRASRVREADAPADKYDQLARRRRRAQIAARHALEDGRA
jgi:hypothetical protein